VALEDIQRMDAEGRIGWIAQETLSNVKKYWPHTDVKNRLAYHQSVFYWALNLRRLN
jgi:hypothetical protein